MEIKYAVFKDFKVNPLQGQRKVFEDMDIKECVRYMIEQCEVEHLHIENYVIRVLPR